jgi:hypothetical protein
MDPGPEAGEAAPSSQSNSPLKPITSPRTTSRRGNSCGNIQIVSMKKGGLSMALVLWAAGSRGGCLSADCTLDDGAHVRPRVLAIAPSVHLALGFLVRS